MKRSLLLAAAIFMLSCSSNEKNDYSLYGNVKSVKLTKYKAISQFETMVKGDIIATETQEYNKDGELTRNESFSDGVFIEDYTREYNEDNKLTKVVGHTEFNHIDYREDYEYDSNGNEISCKVWDIDTGIEDLRSNIISEYDQDNNRLSSCAYLSDGSVVQQSLWEYKDGVCVKFSKISYGELAEERIYDEQSGDIIKCTEYYTEYVIPIRHRYISREIVYNYNKKGKPTGRTITSYIDPGDALVENSRIPQASLRNTVKKYTVDKNELDVKMEYTQYRNGNDIDFTAVQTKLYDEHLNKIETSNKYSDQAEPDVFTNTYKYDNKGNWIEQVFKDNTDDNHNSITTRTIIYY